MNDNPNLLNLFIDNLLDEDQPSFIVLQQMIQTCPNLTTFTLWQTFHIGNDDIVSLFADSEHKLTRLTWFYHMETGDHEAYADMETDLTCIQSRYPHLICDFRVAWQPPHAL